MPVAYINIGSNMGDRQALLEQAVAHIEDLNRLRVLLHHLRDPGVAVLHAFIVEPLDRRTCRGSRGQKQQEDHAEQY